jgi:hypothetical protein
MNNFCVDLRLNIPLFSDNEYVDALKHKPHYLIDIKYLSLEIRNFFDSKNLTILMCESFYRRPHQLQLYQVHKDGMNFTDVAKMNWVFQGEDSLMNWYTSTADQPNVNQTLYGTEYYYYNRDTLELVHSQRVGFPSLVQVGLPHDITTGDEERLCVSIMLGNKNSYEYIKFNDALTIFNDYISYIIV